MEKPSKLIACLLIAVLLSGVAFTLWLREAPPPEDIWFSAPDTVRPWAEREYLKLTGPKVAPPPIDPHFLDSLLITQTNHTFYFTGFNTHLMEDRAIGREVVRVPAGESYEFSGGEIRLEAVGIHYGSNTNLAISRAPTMAPIRFFRPDGTPYETAEPHLLLRVNDNFQSEFPSSFFILGASRFANWSLVSARLVDARTHVTLGTSSRASEGLWRTVRIRRQAWHSGPVELMVDVLHGPTQTIKIPAREGEVIRGGPWELHLVRIGEGDEGAAGLSDRVRVYTQTGRTNNRTSLLFLGTPFARGVPVDFVALDEQGNSIPTERVAHGTAHISVRVHARPERIKTLKARVRTPVRVIFELPEIYRQPALSPGVTNLFDIEFPPVIFNSVAELERFLETIVQLRARPALPVVKYPANHFPWLVQDMSVRELWQEHLRHATNARPIDVVIDQDAGEVEFVPDWRDRLIGKIRGFFE